MQWCAYPKTDYNPIIIADLGCSSIDVTGPGIEICRDFSLSRNNDYFFVTSICYISFSQEEPISPFSHLVMLRSSFNYCST